MFNFSANHITILSSLDYSKCIVYIVKDFDTCRCYKVYDYSKSSDMIIGCVYCISGKVNAADKLYLILENYKVDKIFHKNNDLIANAPKSGATIQGTL